MKYTLGRLVDRLQLSEGKPAVWGKRRESGKRRVTMAKAEEQSGTEKV